MSRARPMLRADTSSEGVGVCTECSGSQPHWPNVELGEATIQIADGPDATVAELVAQSMSANSQPEPPPEGGITTRDWSVDKLLDRYSERFRSVRRVSALTLSQKELEDEIARFEKEGRPLIIEGYHRKEEWPTERFGVDWLCRHGPEDVRTRNVRDWTDGTMKMNEFIEYCRKTSPHGTVAESSRLYGKDVDCPTEWRDWLNHSGILPPMLLEEDAENFMNRLPTSDRVETLMCYLGIGDTFTPAHKDLCASTGHNLMCYTENSGSSFWFMTESSAAPNVMKYFQSVGQELDLETHAMSLDEFARAPFTVYIAEQKLGDLVLVPPRSCHQVVNNGGLTIKASWSRMTLGGLKTALYHELPIYRRVCRSETYRVKSIIYQSLQYYTQILQANWSAVQERNFSSPLDAGSKSRSPSSPSRDTMSGSRKSGTILDGPATADKQKSIQTLQELLKLFDDILGEEYHPQHAALSRVSPPDPDYQHSWHYTCDFCGCDIFQSFFECKHCGITDSQQEKGTGDGIILCTSCYVEGRTCKCTRMDPAQRFSFDALVEQRNRASRVLEELAPGEGPAQLSLDISSRKSPFNKDANSLSVLRAAMALQKIRKKQANSRDARVCTDRRERSSHHAPALSVVPCKRCHGSLCLEHLLVLGIHAASVFLERSKDDPLHDRWHDFHRRKKTDLIRENRANNAVATGSPLALEDRLLIAAAEFKVCRPVKERWVKLGFYDSHVQVLNVSHKFKKVPVRRPNNPLSGPSTSGSPLTELAVTPEPEDISAPTHLVKNMLICASSDSGNVSASPVAGTSASPENDSHATRQRTPRSRSLLDCVEIPPLKRKSTVPLAEPRPSKKVKVLNAGATQSPSPEPLPSTSNARQRSSSSSEPAPVSTQTLASLYLQPSKSRLGPEARLMLSGKQSSVSPNLSSSGLVRQTIRSSRGRKGPPGVKEKDVAALPPGSVLTLGSSRRGSPYQTEARQLMAESRAQTATVTVREMPSMHSLPRTSNTELNPASLDVDPGDRRSDSATDAVPTNNSISGRPTSQQTLPQADSAMLRRTSRAIQTIYMRPSEESSTSVTVNGTDTDARICRLEDEVRECRRENASSKQEARQAKEISRRCEEELFRLRGLLNGQSVAIRGLQGYVSYVEQDCNNRLSQAQAEMEMWKRTFSSKLDELTERVESSKKTEAGREHLRTLATESSSHHPGPVSHVIHTLQLSQAHPAVHEALIPANAYGFHDGGAPYFPRSDDRSGRGRHPPRQPDAGGSYYNYNSQSRPYPQDNGWPPREPRHHRARGHRPQQPRNHRHNHTGEHWPQHHGSHHYDHGRDVGTPPIPRRDETSTCDREQRKSPRQADRLQTRKEHPTVSELESGIPSGLQTDERSNKEPDERSMEKTQEQREEREEETNKQMEGPIEERRHEQDPSASETEHWEDQYEQPDGYPIGDALDFPRDVAILDKQASKDSPRIAQEGDDHRPDYYINDPDHNPWQGSL